MTPQNLQATFPAATGKDAAAGWAIDRRFLVRVTDHVWQGGKVAVASGDVQAILLAAIEIANETKPS